MENAYIEAKIRKEGKGRARGTLEMQGDDGTILWLTFELLTTIATERKFDMESMLRAFEMTNERRKNDSAHKVIAVDKSELRRQLEEGL